MSNQEYIEMVKGIEDKGITLPDPVDKTKYIYYKEGSKIAKQKYCRVLEEILKDKYWFEIETLQYWSVCSCRIFHERYYEKTVKYNKKYYKELVDRTINGRNDNPYIVHYEEIEEV